MKRNIGKLALLFVVGGYFLIFSAPLAWGQYAYTPEQYNTALEAQGLNLTSVEKTPYNYVKVVDGKKVFGTTVVAYTPEQYNALFEAYGLTLKKPEKAPLNFVKVVNGKNVFGTAAMGYAKPEYLQMLEAYGVSPKK